MVCADWINISFTVPLISNEFSDTDNAFIVVTVVPAGTTI
jgi:hypothetical protein